MSPPSQLVITTDDSYIRLHDLLADFHITIPEDQAAEYGPKGISGKVWTMQTQPCLI